MNSEITFQTNTYTDEWQQTLSYLKQRTNYLPEMDYFFHLAEQYYTRKNFKEYKFILISPSFPEELIYALNEKPYWVLGGSLGTFDIADSRVPRDADAVSQSILGYLIKDNFELVKDRYVILPIICDSMRKLSHILSEYTTVIPIDFPPNKTSAFSKEKWTAQMHRIAEQLEKISKKNMTKERLTNAVSIVNEARTQAQKFHLLSQKCPSIISPSLKLFLLNTYYFADYLPSWSRHLKLLNDDLEKQITYNPVKNTLLPQVLVLGSPIYFPNFKLPKLLTDCNLLLHGNINPMTEKMNSMIPMITENSDFLSYFDEVVWNFYQNDTSNAYYNNITLYDIITNLTRYTDFDGVIYHVLKGQIEYDFDLIRYEEFFSTKKIPVFRLETDYKYQDIEQLRIRVEAFREMLVQNLYKKARKIV